MMMMRNEVLLKAKMGCAQMNPKYAERVSVVGAMR